MAVIQKKTNNKSGNKAAKIIRVVGVIVVAFGLLYVFESSRNDGTDYEAAMIKQLRDKGYNVKVEEVAATKKPDSIHIQQQQITHPDEDEPAPVDGQIVDVYNRELPHGKPWPSPIELLGKEARLKMVPLYGKHRPDSAEVVFGFARGANLENLVRFVGSLVASGFKGDIVIAVSQKNDLSKDVQEFLEFHVKYNHLIVYTTELVCKKIKLRIRCKVFKMFSHATIGGYLPDPRPHREIGQLRFEYYWAWSTLYSPQSKLFLLDTKDLLFQSNPFEKIPANLNMEKSLWVWEESDVKNLGDDPDNRLWLREGHERKYLHKLGRRPVVCAGTILGGAPAIEMMTRALVNQWDETLCTIVGCDQGHFNFLVHGNFLVGSPNITDVKLNKYGDSFVMSLGIEAKYGKSLRKSRLVQGGSDKILNKKKEVAAIAHQFDTDEELKRIYLGKKTESYMKEWEAAKAVPQSFYNGK